MTARGALLALALVAGACGPASPEPARPAAEPEASPVADPERARTAEPAATHAGGECLPLVHGCGCAYDCARAVGPTEGDPGTVWVERSGGGPPFEASRTSWCDGQAFGCPGGRPGFYDRTPCGGECVPTRAFDGCHLENGRCVP